jgi:predicted amidohydrolase
MLDRRLFLAGAGSLGAASAAATRTPSTAGEAPRKVIVGSVVQAFWVKHPGLDKRLKELTGILDRMQALSQKKYGRGLDLAILPETVITGEGGGETLARSVAWDGPVGETFGRKARDMGAYLIVPTYLRDAANRCSNAAVLVNRKGNVMGTYRKVHLVPSVDGKVFEGGATPGEAFPVFHCDFGKLGIQICYDMEFEPGWRELANKEAELIAWPTQSPQTAHPAARALQQRCYIVSSTWRDNASVFEPIGKIVAQVRTDGDVLAQEIDLSYAILPWTSKLRRGEALKEKFGDKVGFRYYHEEDLGMFWSNDPKMPIRQMAQSLGLVEAEDELERVRQCYRQAGVPGY